MALSRSPKDLGAGAMYVVLGAAALWFGAEYRMGTAGEMGPGYFPKVLAVILIGIGAVSAARSFVVEGEPIAAMAWKPLLLVVAATALFGVLVTKAGLVAAVFVLVLLSAAASPLFRFSWKAAAGLVALIAACALVFVKGLGIPMPIVGPWLQPFLRVFGG